MLFIGNRGLSKGDKSKSYAPYDNKYMVKATRLQVFEL